MADPETEVHEQHDVESGEGKGIVRTILARAGVDDPADSVEDKKPDVEQGNQHSTAETIDGAIAAQAGVNLDVARRMAITMHETGVLQNQDDGDLSRLPQFARGRAFKFTAPHPTNGVSPDNMCARIEDVRVGGGSERVIIVMGESPADGGEGAIGKATRLVIERDATGKVTVHGSEIGADQLEKSFSLDDAADKEPGDAEFDYHTATAEAAVQNAGAALHTLEQDQLASV